MTSSRSARVSAVFVLGSILPVAAVLLAASLARGGQTLPPVGGTLTTEATVQQIDAGGTIVVKTVDGVERTFRLAKDLLVHGKKGDGPDALAGLRKGSTVVVHYTKEGAEEKAREIDYVGDDGLRTTEGIVTRIDRRRKEIVIRFDDGKTETLKLTDRAAADAGKDVDRVAGASRVVVYYADEGGQKVAHFFKVKKTS